MKVLVTGVTGTVGNLVVHQLLEKGNSEVTVPVRSRERADFPDNVRVEAGDLSKAAACKKALDGQDDIPN